MWRDSRGAPACRVARPRELKKGCLSGGWYGSSRCGPDDDEQLSLHRRVETLILSKNAEGFAVNTQIHTAPPLFSPDFLRDPYPTYRQHLAGPGIQALPIRADTWAVFGYDACANLLRLPGITSVRPPKAIVAVADEERAPFKGFIDHVGRWLLFLDAPAHTRLRKLMNKGFAPLTMERLRPRVVAAVDSLLRRAEALADFDVIRDFAYPLPVRIISELLGVPESLHDRCIALSTDIATWMGQLRRNAEDSSRARAAVEELIGYFEAAIRERSAGRQDLLHLLLEMLQSEAGTTLDDIHAQCVLLLVAGHETTRNLIGNGVYTLLTHGQSRDELREDPKLISAAVEEVLRFESPVQAFGRATLTDLEIDGVQVPAGSSIYVVIGAAHRDPSQFANPERFDIQRKHIRHMAFGGDAHVCLGSTLARLEGQIAIAALLERFPSLRLVDQTPDWGTNFAFRGLRSLRVAV
jgi:cytochrome P450